MSERDTIVGMLTERADLQAQVERLKADLREAEKRFSRDLGGLLDIGRAFIRGADAKRDKAIMRGVEFYRQVEACEAGWLYAFRCRQERLDEAHRQLAEAKGLPTDGEVCQSCGSAVAVVWAAKDEDWRRVVGGPGGLRCPKCFAQAAARNRLSLAFIAVPLEDGWNTKWYEAHRQLAAVVGFVRCESPKSEPAQFVSRDMALDAGEPTMEGTLLRGELWEPCGDCEPCHVLADIPRAAQAKLEAMDTDLIEIAATMTEHFDVVDLNDLPSSLSKGIKALEERAEKLAECSTCGGGGRLRVNVNDPNWEPGPLRTRPCPDCTTAERAEKLAEALRKYGSHGSGCLAHGWKRGDNEYRCNCGLDAALREEGK